MRKRDFSVIQIKSAVQIDNPNQRGLRFESIFIFTFSADLVMDLVKVFEQTVRDLKREVNLKVLKIPEIEQKVLDATDEEPWGPHGSALAEIAQATKKFSECQMVMNVLWTRLTETGKNWRLVYKALTVIEYLVAHGSERAVDEIVEHTFQISSLASFEYVEPSGKDSGLNVRKKAETIVSLLNDKDKIQEVRNKASTNRDKYFGLSSTGITFKSGAASFSSSDTRSRGQYGGYGAKKDGETFRDTDEYGEEKYEKKLKSKKEPPRYGSMEKSSPATGMSDSVTNTKKLEKNTSVPPASALPCNYEEDTEDFDPRGSTTLKPPGNTQSVPSFQDVDLFGEPIAAPTVKANSMEDSLDNDLFADASFVSVTPATEVQKPAALQSNVDLFASHPTPVVSTTEDFFATVSQPTSASKSDTTSSMLDPFASIPLSNFDATDAFASHTSSSVTEPVTVSQSYEPHASVETKPTSTPEKKSFHVKSDIWADSLSRGLIDLNIAAPKKVNLADVGIVGGLTDAPNDKDKGPSPSLYMGESIGMGYGASKSVFPSASGSIADDDFFSSLSGPHSQNQFGSFQK